MGSTFVFKKHFTTCYDFVRLQIIFCEQIPPTVGMRYTARGEWVGARKTGDVVIPMITFIEGGMTIPMGTITRNYLRFFRLSPT